MQIGDTLIVPAVAYREKISVGELLHVIVAEHRVRVEGVTNVFVSPKVRLPLYRLSDGQSVLIAPRKLSDPPPEAQGILRETAPGRFTWTFHRRLQAFEEQVANAGWARAVSDVRESWSGAFRFKASTDTTPGLRPPQVGALHAVGMHWSLKKQPATVVMPTGTGKTEAMIAMLVAYLRGPLVVTVPSRVLREQISKKFATLGLLRTLEVVPQAISNPVVAVLESRPKTPDDLLFLERCHVVVGTIGVMGQGTAADLVPAMATSIEALVVDEAHHISADTWAAFRAQFLDKPIVQFTATPFRLDGKLVDGQVIYEYPLRTAQEAGYFKRISFEPVFQVDPDEGDLEIAVAAIDKLRADLAAGRSHLMMARCGSIARATNILDIYQQLAADLSPIVVHSESADNSTAIADLRAGRRRIVICVDMLGEGFDLPELKIAALHDVHKSLGVVLQFTGRFTRSAGDAIGNATVIANIANQEVSSALERLYSEDADWNQLLSEFSSEAIRAHRELVDFLRESRPIAEVGTEDSLEISPHLLRPKFSTAAYHVDEFQAARFFEGVPTGTLVQRHWLHRQSNTLYFVTRSEPELEWTRSHDLLDLQWDLFVLHFDAARRLLFVHSSDKSSLHEGFARAVSNGTQRLIMGDTMFKALGHINRLRFQNIGLKKRGRRNLRFALYTGADVAEALTQSERAGSEKSNLSGDGWERGGFVTIGCSFKGRVWSREQGYIPEFVRWAEAVGAKLIDDTIDTGAILRNVLVPEELTQLPETTIVAIEWPIELLRQAEDRIVLVNRDNEHPFYRFSIEPISTQARNGRIEFSVFGSDGWEERLGLELDDQRGFVVRHLAGAALSIRAGRLQSTLAEYLSEYPPLIRFVDMSELDGHLRVAPRDMRRPDLPLERFETWDWAGVDIGLESMWRAGVFRPNSIQGRVAQSYQNGGFQVVFDDDSAGEAADLVCLREEDDHIRLVLVHCKFSGGNTPGERVKDVVEVASQAVRSAKWQWRFRDLCRHVVARERDLQQPYRNSRFIRGSAREINRFLSLSRFKPARAEIVIVQPGIQRDQLTDAQAAVLAAAISYIKETVDVDLDIICS